MPDARDQQPFGVIALQQPQSGADAFAATGEHHSAIGMQIGRRGNGGLRQEQRQSGGPDQQQTHQPDQPAPDHGSSRSQRRTVACAVR